MAQAQSETGWDVPPAFIGEAQRARTQREIDAADDAFFRAHPDLDTFYRERFPSELGSPTPNERSDAEWETVQYVLVAYISSWLTIRAAMPLRRTPVPGAKAVRVEPTGETLYDLHNPEVDDYIRMARLTASQGRPL